jgi:hypothetical protein
MDRPPAPIASEAYDPHRTLTTLAGSQQVAKYLAYPLTDPCQFDILKSSSGWRATECNSID